MIEGAQPLSYLLQKQKLEEFADATRGLELEIGRIKSSFDAMKVPFFVVVSHVVIPNNGQQGPNRSGAWPSMWCHVVVVARRAWLRGASVYA